MDERIEKIANADFSDVKKYVLVKPVKVMDREFTELEIDFDSLTGMDMDICSAHAGETSTIKELDTTYLFHIICRACKNPKLNINELKQFSIKDCTALKIMAQSFLMGAVSRVMEN